MLLSSTCAEELWVKIDCKSTVNSPVQLRRNSAKRCEPQKNSEGAALHLPWVPEVFLACGGNFRCWPERLEQARDVKSEKPCPDLHAKTSFSLSERRTFHEVLLFSGEIRSRRIERAAKIDLASPRHSDSRGQ